MEARQRQPVRGAPEAPQVRRRDVPEGPWVKQVATPTRTLKYHHRYAQCYSAHASKGTLCVRTTVRYDRLEARILRPRGGPPADDAGGSCDGGAGGGAAEHRGGASTPHATSGATCWRRSSANPLPALSEELENVDREIASAVAEARALEQRIAAASPKMVEARTKELHTLLHSKDHDRAHINALLKTLLSGIVIDYDDAVMRFQWAHGGESDCMYSFPTH